MVLVIILLGALVLALDVHEQHRREDAQHEALLRALRNRS